MNNGQVAPDLPRYISKASLRPEARARPSLRLTDRDLHFHCDLAVRLRLPGEQLVRNGTQSFVASCYLG